MRTIRILSIAICLVFPQILKAQNDIIKNSGIKIVTLSNGKYEEFHDNDTIVEIGSALFNTMTGEIVGIKSNLLEALEIELQPEIISRWMCIDPLAEEYHDWTPYHYVKNNPILRIDPDGRTDYKINKETGAVEQVGDKNDDPDRVVKTDKEGNVKKKGEGLLGFMVRDSKKGENKVAFGGIEKGILEDGMNFKTDDNIVQVGGDVQPSIEGVESFILGLSDYVDKEIAAITLSGEGQEKASAMYIDEYAGNTATRANITIKSTYIGDAKYKDHYHSHLSRFDASDKYKASEADREFKKSQSKFFNRFVIITDKSGEPIEY